MTHVTLYDAACLALEALKRVPASGLVDDAIAVLNQVLSQPKDKPFGVFQYDMQLDAWVENRDGDKGVAFYTDPR